MSDCKSIGKNLAADPKSNLKRGLDSSKIKNASRKKKKRRASESEDSSSSSSSSSSSPSSSSSSSSSSASSSSSSSSSYDKKKKKSKKSRKILREKQKKLKAKLKIKEKKLKAKLKMKNKKNKSKLKSKEELADDIVGPLPLPNAQEIPERSRLMAPMTKEEWEKKQSVVRRVYDEATGRHRLIKGDGEVIEEIVSKQRHRDINRQATEGDGTSFQNELSSRLGQNYKNNKNVS